MTYIVHAETIYYVVNTPGFWSALGYTIASAMFVGSIIYNGELRLAMKGVATILSYVLFLLIITTSRVSFIASSEGIQSLVRAEAGITTIYITSVAYVLGMVLGVLITSYARKVKHGKDKQA